MILILIKFAQDMDQVIHGVNNYRKFALYNFPLSIQILAINLFVTCIGFIILIFFNFYLIKNDDTIQLKKINANDDLNKIQSFLEKNAIVRVPVFDDTCIGEVNQSCDDKNKDEDVFVHHSGVAVNEEQYKYLVQGEYVEFRLSETNSNSKYPYQASSVTGMWAGKLMCETRNEMPVRTRGQRNQKSQKYTAKSASAEQ